MGTNRERRVLAFRSHECSYVVRETAGSCRAAPALWSRANIEESPYLGTVGVKGLIGKPKRKHIFLIFDIKSNPKTLLSFLQ